jgi:prophage regulatory protein
MQRELQERLEPRARKFAEDVSLWRLPRVEAETGYKRASLYRLIKLGQFPAPVKIGERASAWIDVEVREWITARIEQSRRIA